MALVINTNIASLNVQRNLNASQNDLFVSLQRLSTGLRINSAKDDAAGLAISNRMTAQIQGLNQGVRNANDGISLSQTAEAGLSTASESLLRIRELAIQSANATNSASDRAALQAEVNQRLQELDRLTSDTEFNGLRLFDGSFVNKSFQVGANANQTINMSIREVSTDNMGIYRYTAANDTSGSGTGSVLTSGIIPASPTTANSVAAQDITLSSATGTSVASIASGATARDIAAAINAQRVTTGIEATAETQVTISDFDAGIVSLDLATDQGSFITVSASVTETDATALISEIQAVSSQTGITAELTTVGSDAAIVLSNSKGDNIVLGNYTNSSGDLGIQVDPQSSSGYHWSPSNNFHMVVTGTVEMTAYESFSVSSTEDDSTGSIFEMDTGESALASVSALSTVDISTQSGSQDAIDIVDGALDFINMTRASLGAIQNRFESSITNMRAVSENLSAARSRIMDADFAQETARLSRAQILQQAGIAILGQANALPQNALSLLQ